MNVRDATAADASAIATLVEAGFAAHIAADWESAAQHEFIAETRAAKLASKLSQAAICLLCERDHQLIGVILLPRPMLVQLFFVAPDQLRQGIGRALWSAVRARLEENHAEVKTVELNSSPYAVRAYEALGFFKISKSFKRKGAGATRMACWLPGESLEKAQHVA